MPNSMPGMLSIESFHRIDKVSLEREEIAEQKAEPAVKTGARVADDILAEPWNPGQEVVFQEPPLALQVNAGFLSVPSF